MTPTQQDATEANKRAVQRFNKDVIERGDAAAFRALVAPDFVNRTAPAGVPPGPEGLAAFLNHVMRAAFPDLKVHIHDLLAEGDKVVTRKTITGTHEGPLFGIPATGRAVSIEVIDIVRLRDGQYVEHWGVNSLPSVVATLREG